MVLGVKGLQAQFKRAVVNADREARTAVGRWAGKITAEISATNPLPGVIEIGWTWGAAPKGAITLGATPSDSGRTKATIYARVKGGNYPTSIPRWFEFGTAPRTQKTTGRYSGQIAAQPYFWPIIRANRRRVNAAIRRAIRKGLLQASSK